MVTPRKLRRLVKMKTAMMIQNIKSPHRTRWSPIPREEWRGYWFIQAGTCWRFGTALDVSLSKQNSHINSLELMLSIILYYFFLSTSSSSISSSLTTFPITSALQLNRPRTSQPVRSGGGILLRSSRRCHDSATNRKYSSGKDEHHDFLRYF